MWPQNSTGKQQFANPASNPGRPRTPISPCEYSCSVLRKPHFLRSELHTHEARDREMRLRLPAIKQDWSAFAEQADKKSWPAAHFFAARADHEIASVIAAGSPVISPRFTHCQGKPSTASASTWSLVVYAGDSWIDQGANLLLIGGPGGWRTRSRTHTPSPRLSRNTQQCGTIVTPIALHHRPCDVPLHPHRALWQQSRNSEGSGKHVACGVRRAGTTAEIASGALPRCCDPCRM